MAFVLLLPRLQARNGRLRLYRACILVLTLISGVGLAGSEVFLGFPGPRPEAARAISQGNILRLENGVLSMGWKTIAGVPFLADFNNRLEGKAWSLGGSDLFRITMDNGETLSSSEFLAIKPSTLGALPGNAHSMRQADRVPGWEVNAVLRHPSVPLEVEWHAVLRDEGNAVRQWIVIRGDRGVTQQVQQVEILDLPMPERGEAVGVYPGSPALSGQTFFAAESPFARRFLTEGRVRFDVLCAVPLGQGHAPMFSSVVGVVPRGQARRGFAYYLNRERARPYDPFLSWNSWFDFLWSTHQDGMASAIATVDKELHQRREVTLDAYAIDDGWDRPQSGLWQIDPLKFPGGFDSLQRQVESTGSHLALWMSPLGGYDASFPLQQWRTEAAIRAGLVSSELDLSIPAYYDFWTRSCLGFVRDYGVRYLKWDNVGFGVNPHFMAVTESAREIRASAPQLYINASVGTWPSPFWLHSVDSIWRGGMDVDFEGVGDSRERWLTYRDSQVFANVVALSPWYPLNSIMVNGVIHGPLAEAPLLAVSGTNLLHEARSFFGSGSQAQELYVTPGWMNDSSWDAIADAVHWAREREEVLADSHWVGGDPRQGVVYGWGAWTPRASSLVLRNPSDRQQAFVLDLQEALEIPDGSPRLFDVLSGYADQSAPVDVLSSNTKRTVTLEPFEVLAMDIFPRLAYPDRVASLLPSGFWRLGESSDSSAKDTAGGPPGTYLNTINGQFPGALTDQDDGCVRLSGPGSRVMLPQSDQIRLGPLDAFSVSLWFRPQRLAGFQSLVSTREWQRGFSLGISGDRQLRYSELGDLGAVFNLGTPLDTRWHHLALVHGNRGVSLFLDGRKVGESAVPVGLASSRGMALGGHPDGDDESFLGSMDEVAVFSRALTRTEVALLHRSQSGLRIPPTLLSSPVSQTRYAGASVSFTVSALGMEPLTYQWRSNGVDIPGATQESLQLLSIGAESSDTLYSARIQNPLGAVVSPEAHLRLVPPDTYAAEVIRDRPLVFWRLDDLEDSTWRDSFGGLDLGSSPSVQRALSSIPTRRSGGVAMFDGTTHSHIDTPYRKSLNGQVFTIEFWARSLGETGGYQSPLTSRDVDPLSGYCFYITPGQTWEFWMGARSGADSIWEVLSGPVVERGKWTHIVGISDGSHLSFYVNGVLQATRASSPVLNLGRPFRLGAGATESTGGLEFIGELGDVSVYAHALDGQAVRRHFELGKSVSPLRVLASPAGKPMVYWAFGNLYRSLSPMGPWTPVDDARSPWSEPALGAAEFYRLEE